MLKQKFGKKNKITADFYTAIENKALLRYFLIDKIRVILALMLIITCF